MPGEKDPAQESAGLTGQEERLLRHIAGVTERTGKPVISVPLCPVQRSVFPGWGPYAPLLLPTPAAAVRALANATWYASRRISTAGG